MNIDRSRTVAFSGHRSFKIREEESTLFSSAMQVNDSLDIRTEKAVCKLCEAGYDTFLCGMAEGFDLLAAEAILRLKKKFHDIRLIAIIPFPGQAANFNPETRIIYEKVLDACDALFTICDRYSRDCFHLRNDFLTDNSSVVVCYYNGSKGGTAYTVKRALRQGSKILNLFR